MFEKLLTEVAFALDSFFLKQVDECAMWGPRSVTINGIYMIKMEENIAESDLMGRDS